MTGSTVSYGNLALSYASFHSFSLSSGLFVFVLLSHNNLSSCYLSSIHSPKWGIILLLLLLVVVVVVVYKCIKNEVHHIWICSYDNSNNLICAIIIIIIIIIITN